MFPRVLVAHCSGHAKAPKSHLAQRQPAAASRLPAAIAWLLLRTSSAMISAMPRANAVSEAMS